MVDLLESCLVDPYFEKKVSTPEAFKRDVCSGCKNFRCANAKGGLSLWDKRISTQEDRLLINPQFADKRDPRFRDIANTNFQDMARQALALEVTSRKGDWSIPTEKEITALTEELTQKPLHFQEVSSGEEGAWEVRGDKGSTYRVTLTKSGTWSCTCPSRVSPCKHVQDVSLRLSRAPEEQKPDPPPISTTPPAVAPKGPLFVPNSMNTSVPSEGFMIGESQPKSDPWAPPKGPVGKVIPVGGKVKFGR